jgi:hypothetical protein
MICPGVHDSCLTTSFLTALDLTRLGLSAWTVPTDRCPPYSGWHIQQFVRDQLLVGDPDGRRPPPLLWIGFSAGVVGAIAAAHLWQSQGGQVVALIAVDGWGVPLAGDFPIHRISHDAFTHWSSVGLGPAGDSFYADPGVPHLDLWRSPHTATGWQTSPASPGFRQATTAATFITALLRQYRDDSGCIA